MTSKVRRRKVYLGPAAVAVTLVVQSIGPVTAQAQVQSPAVAGVSAAATQVATAQWTQRRGEVTHRYQLTVLRGGSTFWAVPWLAPPPVATYGALYVSHGRCSSRQGARKCSFGGPMYELDAQEFEFDPLARSARVSFRHGGRRYEIAWQGHGDLIAKRWVPARERSRLNASNVWWEIDAGLIGQVGRRAHAQGHLPRLTVPAGGVTGALFWHLGVMHDNSACVLDRGRICN